MTHPDFSLITESPGLQATQEQIERVYHRYHFAKQFCIDKAVLEVACGTGIGLGYLATLSKNVWGGDIDDKNLSIAKSRYQSHPKIKLQKMDAHQLDLPDASYDVVLLYEAIYYLKEPQKFIEESFRVLKPQSILIICSVNKDWKDFHPSPFTYRYFSIPEMVELLKKKFSEVKVYGAFKIQHGIKSSVFSLIKRLASKLDLIPGSLKLRAYLKRVFIGKTFPLPNEINEGMTEYESPAELDSQHKNFSYKIIYFVGRK